MNINLTLIIQMIVFLLLVFFTMSFIWPPLMRAVEERQKKIAQGLAAADRGEQELQQARQGAEAILREARERAGQIIDQAQHRANDIVEQARVQRQPGRVSAWWHRRSSRSASRPSRARESLRQAKSAGIAVAAPPRSYSEREIDRDEHARSSISKLAAQI